MMNIKTKLNKNILIALGILALLAFALIALIPHSAHAQYENDTSSFPVDGIKGYNYYQLTQANTDNSYPGPQPVQRYSNSEFNGYGSNTGGYNNNTNSQRTTSPVIDTITPDSVSKSGSATVTVIGYNFNPNSLVRVNGSDRFATFVDPTKLVFQMTSSDTASTGSKSISVLNPGANGGLSNSVTFTIKTGSTVKAATIVKKSTSTTKTTSSNTSYKNDSTSYNNTQNYSALTSNALYGSNSFLPTGIFQWILAAILILIIVIITRKIITGKQDGAHGHHDPHAAHA